MNNTQNIVLPINNLTMDIYRRKKPNSANLTQKEKAVLSANNLQPKPYVGRGTDIQRTAYSNYLNQQVAIFMRPKMTNNAIQAKFRKDNADYYKQRRKYLNAGFTNFSKRKITATNKLNNITMAYKRGRIFRTLPNNKIWSSYFTHTLKLYNEFMSPEQWYLYNINYQMTGNLPPYMDLETLENIFKTYQISEFLKQQLRIRGAYKVFIIGTFYACMKNVEGPAINLLNRSFEFRDDYNVGHSGNNHTQTITNEADVDRALDDWIHLSHFGDGQGYLRIVAPKEFTFSFAKLRSIAGGSYVELPPWIMNKKAIVNIKNDDSLCFVYSVLASLYPVLKDANRVSNYKTKLTKLKYDNKPMEIKDIGKFERDNGLAINVFGLEHKDSKMITPLYISKVENKERINIFLYEKHYSLIKNKNRLFGMKDEHPFFCDMCCCCSFTRKEALENHQKSCVTGQRVVMPTLGKDDVVKFKDYKSLVKMPIFISCDFEAYQDTTNKTKSKNGNTELISKHTGASFRLLVVSEIPLLNMTYSMVDKMYLHTFEYCGDDADSKYVEYMNEIHDLLIDSMETAIGIHKDYKNIVMTPEQEEHYKHSKTCSLCHQDYNHKNHKVRHHCHYTGEYSDVICNECNLKIKSNHFIPVFFHNLNYDKNIFLKFVDLFDGIDNISVLADNSEKFKCFNVKKYKFLDSFKFMASSLDSLIKNIPEKERILLNSITDDENQRKYINKKGFFPYDWFDTLEKFDFPLSELKREDFDNKMRLSKLTNEEWEYVLEFIKEMKLKTFKEYHDIYLKCDVYGLADVIINFRKTSINKYQLDPCHYVGAPSYAWNAMLKKTNVQLELLTDIEMYQFFEGGIRGGQSIIMSKHMKANNPYLPDYNPNEKTTYLVYVDANNLYGVSMVSNLPHGNFKWCKLLTREEILNYQDGAIGYTLNVDLRYPKELHDTHNDYPLACERRQFGITSKLCGTFEDKINYTVDIRNLKYFLEQGMELIQVNKCLQYDQSRWLAPWIEMNTEFRKESKNDFEKDFFKLMNNSVFGKTMENVRGRIDMKIATTEKYSLKYTNRPNCKTWSKLGDRNINMIILSKTMVKLDKPIYAGFCILELSKLHMYKHHYDYMKPKYGDKCKLLATDTDSFIYGIETPDIYKDMSDNKEHYDLLNSKNLGLFKDECGDSVMSEFVGIRSKVYSFVKYNPKTKEYINKKTLKGVPTAIKENVITFEDYKNCVFQNQDLTVPAINIRSKALTNYSTNQTKLALRNFDDKRVWDGLDSKAYGHYKLE
jgi:hypothetical protein